MSISLTIALLISSQTPQTLEQIRQQHDQEIRSQDAAQDWWLVSTTLQGLKQHRFYVDRDAATSMQSESRAWVDHFEVVRSKPRLEISHEKFLAEAKCERDPLIRYTSGVQYKSDGSVVSWPDGPSDWKDVVPGSSMQTLWRFICHSEPANAIVFVPDGPEADALLTSTKPAEPRPRIQRPPTSHPNLMFIPLYHSIIYSVTPDLFRGPSSRKNNACTPCGNMDAGTSPA